MRTNDFIEEDILKIIVPLIETYRNTPNRVIAFEKDSQGRLNVLFALGAGGSNV